MPPLLDADPAKLPPMADPRSDRKEAYVSLRAERPHSEPGMVLDSLNEIHKILRDREGYGGKDVAQPKGGSGTLVQSAPTIDEPGKDGAVLFAHTPPQPAAPPSRRNGTPRAVLAVTGLALLGAMSLVAVRETDLSHRAAGAAGQGASPAGDHSETVAVAALPPARTVAVAKSNAARPPTTAPQHSGAALGSAAPPAPAVAVAKSDANRTFLDEQIARLAHLDEQIAQLAYAVAVAKDDANRTFFDEQIAQLAHLDGQIARLVPTVAVAKSDANRTFFDQQIAQLAYAVAVAKGDAARLLTTVPQHPGAAAGAAIASRTNPMQPHLPTTSEHAAAPPADTVTAAKNNAARPPIARPQHPVVASGTTTPSWINPPQAGAEAQPTDGGFARQPVIVAQWSFRSGNQEIAPTGGHISAWRPLILRIVLDGNAAAEQIRSGGLAIEVRWTRDTPGAPSLVTRLAVGNRSLAGSLAAEARRNGFFVWHTWAEKTALSPGTWDVSLTDPNGRPLACGNPSSPCRFHVTVG